MIRRLVIILGVAVILMGVFLGGCSESKEDQRLWGTWLGTYTYQGMENTTVPANITFRANGTFHSVRPMLFEDGTWSFEDGVLAISRYGGIAAQYTVMFSQNDSRVVLRSVPSFGQWNLTKMT